MRTLISKPQQRQLRYYTRGDTPAWSWYGPGVPEAEWNEVEKDFVAIMDAAFSDEESREYKIIPGFGSKFYTRLAWARTVIYYAGDVNEPDYQF